MMKNKRVGTFTLGAVLIALGILFLLKTFGLQLDYTFILSFWPVMLISLGLEVLFFNFKNQQAAVRYDVGAFFLLFITVIFTFALAGAQFILTNFPQIIPM